MVTDTVAQAVAFETVIGLEIHAQLATHSKMFCGCSAAAFTGAPNANVCPICMGMPGVLPVINREAVRQAVRVALALHGEVQRESKFDRKNYTYPDLPKGYQISQYDLPLSRGGSVTVITDAGERQVGITRVHMEEDTGRSLHRTHADGSGYSLVDLNRAGVPLLEIVSEPDMRSPEEAREYLVTLRDILRYIGASTGNMEEGALRCDANVSLRSRGATEFGAKVEIKNVNSFRGVYHALQYEVQRQATALRAGGTLIQETRGWSEERGVTLPQRTKEYADDYRYFPEPDLPTLVLSDAFIEEARRSLPELPDVRRHRFIVDYGTRERESLALTSNKDVADWFELMIGPNPSDERKRLAISFMLNGVFAVLKERAITIDEAPSPRTAAGFLDALESHDISLAEAQDGFSQIRRVGTSTSAPFFIHDEESERRESERRISEAKAARVNDTDELTRLVDEAIIANPKAVSDYRSGKHAAINALVGTVMKAEKGANFQVVRELLIQRLAATE